MKGNDREWWKREIRKSFQEISKKVLVSELDKDSNELAAIFKTLVLLKRDVGSMIPVHFPQGESFHPRISSMKKKSSFKAPSFIPKDTRKVLFLSTFRNHSQLCAISFPE